jgi:predicted nucleic acid-binding protein
MRRFFADTFYWIALLLRRDAWHEQVTAFTHTLRRDDRFVTTDAILLEFLAAFSDMGPYLRQQAVDRVRGMLANPSIRVIEITRARLLEGLTLYEARPDKEYSLTDCISMETMRRERLTDVLTNDHHFTQEGFTILFP